VYYGIELVANMSVRQWIGFILWKKRVMAEKLSYQELEDKITLLELKLEVANKIKQLSVKNSQFLQVLLDTIPSPIFYKNIDGVYQNCNDAFSQTILGINKEKVINKSLLDLEEYIPTDLAARYHAKDQEFFNLPNDRMYQESIRCADGNVRIFSLYKASVHNDRNEIIGVVGILSDVTEFKKQKRELKAINIRLETDSLTDPLTGLFNRRKFEDIFLTNLRIAKRYNRLLNFAILDIDNFKNYNDTFGHLAGDNALVLIAKTLQDNLHRADDYVFRLGGEEFGILYYSENESKAEILANNVRMLVQNLNIKHNTDDEFNCLTISLGMVKIKDKSTRMLTIYDKADSLLYRAKNAGKNQILSMSL